MTANDAKTAIQSLHAFGKDQGHRITAPREYVLGIIAAAQQPMTAYDVLDALGAKLKNPKPPTAYRALDFLVEHGFVHRIESLNAYIACAQDHKHQGSQFMICDSCGFATEVHLCSIPDGLKKQADGHGFSVSYWNAELHGRCGKCA